jgi:hypothetical protein
MNEYEKPGSTKKETNMTKQRKITNTLSAELPNYGQRRTARSAFARSAAGPKMTTNVRIEKVLEIYAVAQADGACKVGMEVETYTGYDSKNAPKRTRKITNPHWPIDGESGQARTSRVAAALRICATCPVQKACENYATIKPPLEPGHVVGGIYFSTPRTLVPAVTVDLGDGRSKITKKAVIETVAAMRRRIVADRVDHDAKVTRDSKIRGMGHLVTFKIGMPASIRVAKPQNYTSDHSVEYVRDILADLLIGRMMTDDQLRKASAGVNSGTLDDVTFDEIPAHIRAASNADRMPEKEND